MCALIIIQLDIFYKITKTKNGSEQLKHDSMYSINQKINKFLQKKAEQSMKQNDG